MKYVKYFRQQTNIFIFVITSHTSDQKPLNFLDMLWTISIQTCIHMKSFQDKSNWSKCSFWAFKENERSVLLMISAHAWRDWKALEASRSINVLVSRQHSSSSKFDTARCFQWHHAGTFALRSASCISSPSISLTSWIVLMCILEKLRLWYLHSKKRASWFFVLCTAFLDFLLKPL